MAVMVVVVIIIGVDFDVVCCCNCWVVCICICILFSEDVHCPKETIENKRECVLETNETNIYDEKARHRC